MAIITSPPCRLQMPGRLRSQCTSAVKTEISWCQADNMTDKNWSTNHNKTMIIPWILIMDEVRRDAKQLSRRHRTTGTIYCQAGVMGHSYQCGKQCQGTKRKQLENLLQNLLKKEKICFQDIARHAPERHCRWCQGVQSRSRCLLLDCRSGCLQGYGFVTFPCHVGCRWGAKPRPPGGPVLQSNLQAKKLQAATAKAFQCNQSLILRGETGSR